MNTEVDIGIILLAAGSSSRMGQSKQLLLVDGEPLLTRSVKVALNSGSPNTVVVLGARQDEHRKVIDHLPVTILFNAQWQDGMGSSLKTGLNGLLEKAPSVNAVIVLVCDQPALTAEHLIQMGQKYKATKASIIASVYANVMGVPALFDRSLFPELLAIGNEEGAKKILRKHHDLILSIDFPQGATDLDTPEDYRTFISP